MQTYISLLRGINVSGQKLIKMADLKELYLNIGFSKVETYIQSGNVLFNADSKFTNIVYATKIEEAIKTKYGFDVPVIVISKGELEKAVHLIPFTEIENFTEYTYISFLSNIPDAHKFETLFSKVSLPERFAIIGQTAYLYCPKGYGKTKLSNNFIESKLKVTATTRNYNTCLKLIEMAGV